MTDREFNQVLQDLMQSRNMSARLLAKDLQLPHKTVADWVGPGGAAPRDLKVLKRLADYFDVSVHRLLFGTEDKRGAITEILQNQGGVFKGVFEVSIRVLGTKPEDS